MRAIRFLEEINGTGAATAGYTEDLCGEWTPERFERLGKELGIHSGDMILANEMHTDRICPVNAGDRGYGVTRTHDENYFDAMLTQERGLLLCVHTADCVPVVLLDAVTKTAGVVHSGWAGTAKNIAGSTVKMMKEKYGCNPADMIAVLGPYAHACCYEVGEDVLFAFRQTFSEKECELFFNKGKVKEKYMLDLGAAVCASLCRKGVKAEHIHDSGLCTFHETGLPSWRRTHDKKSQILTFIMLR